MVMELLQMAQHLRTSLVVLGAQAHSKLDAIELRQQPVQVPSIRHHGAFPVVATCRHGLQDHERTAPLSQKHRISSSGHRITYAHSQSSVKNLYECPATARRVLHCETHLIRYPNSINKLTNYINKSVIEL